MGDVVLPSAVSRARQSHRLRQIIARCQHAPGRPAPRVVFDLDGTLLDNRPRTAAILHELAQSWRATQPAAARAIDALSAEGVVYSLWETLTRLGISQQELHVEADEFWRARFFFDDWLAHDVPLPGATEFCRACHAQGATLVYFTGRDLPNMALGTFRSLRDCGFPIGVPGTELVLKPTTEITDVDFKRAFTPAVCKPGRVVGAFDNEPGNCNLFAELTPDADVMWVASGHAPSPPALAPGVTAIEDLRLEVAP